MSTRRLLGIMAIGVLAGALMPAVAQDEPSLFADFLALQTSGPLPLEVEFRDLSLGDPTSWRWDFGDGAAAYGPSQSHTYHTAGSYTVSLTVSNTVSSDTATASIHVNAPPPSAFP
jgi:PKD repeat protein